MPTENPKISAYVPQAVYDHFKEYQQERGISMSQAAIEIFAHYFGLDLEVPTKEFTGGLPGKVLQIEQSLEQLKNLYIELVAKVDCIKFSSGLLEDNTVDSLIDERTEQGELSNELPSGLLTSEKNEDHSKLPSELQEDVDDLQGNLPSEPQEDVDDLQGNLSSEPQEVADDLQGNLPSEPQEDVDDLQGNLPSEPQEAKNFEEEKSPHQQLDIFPHISQDESAPSSETLSELPIRITAKALVSRLGGTEGSLKNKKSELNQEQFAEWSGKKDPDGIKWQSVKENRRLYYCPISSLTSELQSKLLALVEK